MIEQVLAFTVQAQDRLVDSKEQRWAGEQRMWLAISADVVWFLYGRAVASDASEPARRHIRNMPEIGGIWDAIARHGLTIHTKAFRASHQLDLSWPQQARLITGRLYGPRSQRERLIGILAQDELRAGELPQ